MKKELSIFIDESGDFGAYQKYCPFYVITFVFHDQKESLKNEYQKFCQSISYLNLPDNYIHAGPIIRKEELYEKLSIQERRKSILNSINFIRKIPIMYHSFIIERCKARNSVEETAELSKLIKDFFVKNAHLFEKYNYVKVYYDNGQIQLTRLLAAVLSGSIKSELILKKVNSKDYVLFQMADVLCSIELTNYKMNKHLFLNTEKAFFKTEKQFIKDFYKRIECKHI